MNDTTRPDTAELSYLAIIPALTKANPEDWLANIKAKEPYIMEVPIAMPPEVVSQLQKVLGVDAFMSRMVYDTIAILFLRGLRQEISDNASTILKIMTETNRHRERRKTMGK